MGNLKWDFGNNGRCPSEAPQVVTGTKGLAPFLLDNPEQFFFLMITFLCFVFTLLAYDKKCN